MRAIWNGTVIAESDDTVMVEGNHYFPPESLNRDAVRDSSLETTCSWKGVAHYYDVVVDGQTNPDAAWHYDDPSDAAASIRGHVAFWRGVTVEE